MSASTSYGQMAVVSPVLLSAKDLPWADAAKGTPLVDHLIGEAQDRIRDRQPDRLRGSEIEDHVELRGLFHG